MPSPRKHPALAALLLVAALALPALAGNWPQWRGPGGDSVSAEKGLPLEWAEGKNVLWKCPLPGDGASTPAVWGDAAFVTCQRGEDLLLLKINTAGGKVEWERTVGTGALPRSAKGRGKQKFHPLHNLASPSPVTDGRRVFAHFGNGDLAAYDFAGRRLWRRNLQEEHGPYTVWWGHANSPVLYEGLVIAACMQDSLTDLGKPAADSYLVAYDQATGEQRWKTARDTGARAEECDAYTTPVFAEVDGRTQMIVMGASRLDAYDPATGARLWWLPGLTGNRTITGPTVAGGVVYATCGMRRDLVAVRPGGAGELPPTAVLWRAKEATPDTPCPVVTGGLLFAVADSGIAQCLDAKTGAARWKHRLGEDHKASPLAAEGRVYFLGLRGRCTVVAAQAEFKKLAENRLEDEFVASPAAAAGRLYLRGRKSLYCLGGR
jgi:outer membrane protein assembly factor BamB